MTPNLRSRNLGPARPGQVRRGGRDRSVACGVVRLRRERALHSPSFKSGIAPARPGEVRRGGRDRSVACGVVRLCRERALLSPSFKSGIGPARSGRQGSKNALEIPCFPGLAGSCGENMRLSGILPPVVALQAPKLRSLHREFPCSLLWQTTGNLIHQGGALPVGPIRN